MSPPRRASDAPRSRELRPPRSHVVPALGSERRSGEPGGIHGCLWRWPLIIGGRSRRDRGGHPGCSAGPAAVLGRTRRSPCGRTSRDTSMPRSGASPSRDPPLRDRSPVPFECRRARPAFMDSTTAYRFFPERVPGRSRGKPARPPPRGSSPSRRYGRATFRASAARGPTSARWRPPASPCRPASASRPLASARPRRGGAAAAGRGSRRGLRARRRLEQGLLGGRELGAQFRAPGVRERFQRKSVIE